MAFDFLYAPWPQWAHQLIGVAGACLAYLITIWIHRLGSWLLHRTEKKPAPEVPRPPKEYHEGRCSFDPDWHCGACGRGIALYRISDRIVHALRELKEAVKEDAEVGLPTLRKCPAFDYAQVMRNGTVVYRVSGPQ